MRRELILTFVLLLTVFLAPAVGEEAAEGPGKLLGDESDGSRAHPTHVLPLFPENEDGEKGEQITPDADLVLPFSTKYTCGECHTYDVIKQGWHFNAVDSNAVPGRLGQPWIYFDGKLGIQIPLSYRAWPGTYQPADFGMTEFRFTQVFGRHMPGGGPGEVTATDVDDIGRQFVAGKLEINCLTCHNGHHGQDQGGVNGYAIHVSVRQNFRWAATASCEFAQVKGSASAMTDTYDPYMPMGDEQEPTVIYQPEAFNADGEVLLDIRREVPNQRCYYCHSNVYHTEGHGESEKWSTDEDVHLKSGLTCVDCHRNGMKHDIIRGYSQESRVSDNPLAATSSCEGCHVPEGSGVPEAARLGAPVPQHLGLPVVHFEKLTCTACHSGPWPSEQAVYSKTSRAHRLGTPNVNKAEKALPHVLSPVFALEAGTVVDDPNEPALHSGKIAPHKAVWPAFWATLAEDKVTPVALDVVEKALKKVFEELESPADGSWTPIPTEKIGEALNVLAEAVEEKVAYVAGGTLYRLDEDGAMVEEADHPAAAAYMWPLAHNVRPAAQSLGIRYCTDCHATDGPFFFGKVAVDSPVVSDTPRTVEQVAFQDIGRFGAWAFAASFVFRPWFKIVAIGSAALIGIVLLLYGLKALGAVARVLAEQNQ